MCLSFHRDVYGHPGIGKNYRVNVDKAELL
jgi:hypothetical protein